MLQVIIYLFILITCCHSTQEPKLLIVSAGHSGQLNPLLTLAKEISDRNINFYFATTLDKKDVIEKIKGATFVSIGENKLLSTEDAVKITQNSPIRSVGSFMYQLELFTTDAIYKSVFDKLHAFVSENRPTMMVIDTAMFAAFDLAKLLQIPYIINVPCSGSGSLGSGDLLSALPAIGTGLPFEMTLAQWARNLLYKVEFITHFIMSPGMKQWFKTKEKMGISDVYDIDPRNSPYEVAFVVNSMLGLDYAGELIKNDIKFSGVMIRDKDEEKLSGSLLQWLDQAPNVVYISLGTVARLTKEQLRELLDGFIDPSAGNMRLLWKLPKDNLDLLPLKNIEKKFGKRFRFETWVPSQITVLQHPSVKLFISHGGGNGFHEGVYAGKPQLVLPLWMDHYDYAERVESLSIGRAIHSAPNFTAKEITENAKEILANSSYTTEAEYWGMRLHMYGGPASYADIVLSCLPRPLSCKIDYKDPMKNYMLAFKVIAPVIVWILFVKLVKCVLCIRNKPTRPTEKQKKKKTQ